METTLIILIAINIGASLLSPLVVSAAYFLRHIKKSSCCSGSIELGDNKSDKEIKTGLECQYTGNKTIEEIKNKIL